MALLMLVMSGFCIVIDEAAANHADAEHIVAYATQVPEGTTPSAPPTFLPATTASVVVLLCRQP